MSKFLPLLVAVSLAGLHSGCVTDAPSPTSPAGSRFAARLADQTAMPTLYARSAENRALAYQAFNIARLRLDQEMARRSDSRPPALIVDLDETVIDNSPFQAERVRTGTIYSTENWRSWTARGRAVALPGARDFLRYAASRGVKVFYVTNRSGRDKDGGTTEKDGTLRNLRSIGFPNVSESSVLFKSTTSSKEERRQTISRNHDILLLMGDNLGDFAGAFDPSALGKSNPVAARAGAVDELRNQFGRKFIVLPNAMYGEWEGALYGFDHSRSESEKLSARMRALPR